MMPLNEMLGNQTETQLWALEMTPIGFRCDDKPIQAKKGLHLTKNSNKGPMKNSLQYLIRTLVVLF